MARTGQKSSELYVWSIPFWPAVDDCLPCAWTGTAHLWGGSAGWSAGLLTAPVSGAQQCDDEALGSQAPGEGGGQDLVPTKGLGTV